MRKTAILVLTLLLSTAAYADHYADTYVIPVVGHVMGANGTMWMSDIAIRNFSATEMTVQLIFIESGSDTSNNVFPLITDDIDDGSVTVGPNSSVMLTDVLDGYMGSNDMDMNAFGALIIGSDRPFAVTSRAYSSRSPLGQTVPPTRDFFENSVGEIDNASVAYVPGIMQNARTRTNVGFVAGSGGSLSTPMVVEVTIRNATGGVSGTRSFTIPQGNFAHHQFSVASIAPNATFDVGTAEFRITQGEGTVVPYASLVDNVTSEAAYIMGQFPESTPAPGSFGRRATTLFRQLLGLQVR
ncbi:MAG TPA: hypothetical protein VE010_12105 [Thermoanaerobaculia bacterium]|nr:hypothetical protein [Thermoanaerobaculia bacterium]